MILGRLAWLVGVSFLVMATVLTGFYFVHEDLPRSLRAPTSLLLAPVAIVAFTYGAPFISTTTLGK